MLSSSPGAAEFTSGAIMYDETIHQKSASDTPFAEALTAWGILPGVKVDTGAKPLAGLLMRPSPKGLTACVTVSGSTIAWVRASRSAGR